MALPLKGITLPLAVGAPPFVEFPAIAGDDDVLAFSLYSILFTRKGSRPGRPEFGSNAWSTVFAAWPLDANAIYAEVLTAAAQDPRIEIVGVEVLPTSISASTVRIVYRRINDPQVRALDLEISNGADN